MIEQPLHSGKKEVLMVWHESVTDLVENASRDQLLKVYLIQNNRSH